MKKILVIVIGVILGILFVINLFRGSNDEAFERTIDEKLNSIIYQKDSSVMRSSNPYDYIKTLEGSKEYNYIVSQGDKSLNYLLEKFDKSGGNGLKEYIMAIACSEILKENPELKNWSSGKEWYNNYVQSHK